MSKAQQLVGDFLALSMTWLIDGAWTVECERRRAELTKALLALAQERGQTLPETISSLAFEFANGRGLPGSGRRRRRGKLPAP